MQAQADDEERIPKRRGKNDYIISPTGFKVFATKFLTAELLCERLLKEKIVENLFGESAHPEILKRAAPVLRFLCR